MRGKERQKEMIVRERNERRERKKRMNFIAASTDVFPFMFFRNQPNRRLHVVSVRDPTN